MTTIVYDSKEKIIACDGLLSGGDMAVELGFEKWIETDLYIDFLSGYTSMYKYISESFAHNQPSEMLDGDCYGFRVSKEDKTVMFISQSDGRFLGSETTGISRTVGSGCDFALASLDHGGSAVEAVKYAATRDLYTGGVITSYNLETGEWLKHE